MNSFGQMSLKRISEEADYLQLDICGLSVDEAIARYKSYNTNIPIILHGDWNKRKGVSENNLRNRVEDYKRIISELKQYTKIIGITIHPPLQSKYSLVEVVSLCEEIEKDTNIDVFLENRSNHKLNISIPEEVIKFSESHKMTIDCPQLYISCKYDTELFYKTLNQINWENIYELHIGNVKDCRVGRKIDDGDLNFKEIFKYIRNKTKKDFYITLEILGSQKTFEEESRKLKTNI